MRRGGLKPSGGSLYSRSRIAKELNRSKNVISNYLNAPEEVETKKSLGRKKKLSAKQERLLVKRA